MRKFFNKHPEFTLAVIAAVFLIIMAASYVWGVTTIVTNVSKATSVGEEKIPQAGFDIQGAAGLDLKGLIR